MSAAGLVGLVIVPEVLLDSNGYRRPVPHEGFEDFREQVLATASTEQLLAEIRYAYKQSEEMRTLVATFDMRVEVNSPVQRALQLRVSSSRKYTRITFPNVPKLKAAIRWILSRHHCSIVGHGNLLDLEYTISTHALGRINEHLDFL